MVISAYQQKWNKVPVSARQFILKAIAILVIWKLLYLFLLLPTRVLDKPLTNSVGSGSAWVLNIFTHTNDFTTKVEMGRSSADDGKDIIPLQNVYFHGQNVVSIEDGCNALELFVLYAGFIICMPAARARKIVFIVGGIILIYIVNVLRCAAIAYIILYAQKYAEFAHHYVFTFVVYGLIIALWLIFSKKLDLTDVQPEH